MRSQPVTRINGLSMSIHLTCSASLFCLIATMLGGCAHQASPVGDAAARKLNSMQLMMEATAARQGGRTADAGFLLLASNARRRIDRVVYPQKEKGADSPNILAGALNATLGSEIMKSVQEDPAAFKEVVDRFAKWEAEFPADYDPGWKYEKKLEGGERKAAVKTETLKVLEPVLFKQRTLANAEYQQLIKSIAEEDRAITQFNKSKSRQPNGKLSPGDLALYESARERKDLAIRRVLQIEWELIPERRWHARAGWKAVDYFSDEQALALCQAIEASDLKIMEELIAGGADVNAVGKEGMTLLLWAYPDHQLERFKCLLEHGANPNVPFEGTFGTNGKPMQIGYQGYTASHAGCREGESVTLLACRHWDKSYFDLVIKHGADPNQIEPKWDVAPLDYVLDRDFVGQPERVEALLALGANPNRYCKDQRVNPLMKAIQNAMFVHALRLIEGGADPNFAPPDRLEGPVHMLVKHEKELATYSLPRQDEYRKLVSAIEKRGVSLAKASEEAKYWESEIEKIKKAKNYRGYKESELPAIKKLIAERDVKRSKDANGTK
jgi:hypothetical protein